MSSFAHLPDSNQVFCFCLQEYRAPLCAVCLMPSPPGYVMNRVRIRALKREADAWSIRFRCPRPKCRGDFSVWVRYVDGEGVKEIAPEDERVWAYVRGEGTAKELGERFHVDGTTIWRNVDRSLNDVAMWMQMMSAFLGRQAPELLVMLLSLVLPMEQELWTRRRFRKPERTQQLHLLAYLPDWVEATQEALGLDWPFGRLRFLRRVGSRLLEDPP